MELTGSLIVQICKYNLFSQGINLIWCKFIFKKQWYFSLLPIVWYTNDPEGCMYLISNQGPMVAGNLLYNYKWQELQVITLSLGVILVRWVRNHRQSILFLVVILFLHVYLFCFLLGVSTSKSAGVQTDETTASAQPIQNDDHHVSDNLSKKLLAVWGSPNEQELGKNVISNLLKACQTDFHSLSGCIGMNISSKLTAVASQNMHDHKPEVAKVSHLYSVLTEVLLYHSIICNSF